MKQNLTFAFFTTHWVCHSSGALSSITGWLLLLPWFRAGDEFELGLRD